MLWSNKPAILPEHVKVVLGLNWEVDRCIIALHLKGQGLTWIGKMTKT